jgi:hypothetical protein
MAHFYECMPLCAQRMLDTADIVRDGDLSTVIELLSLSIRGKPLGFAATGEGSRSQRFGTALSLIRQLPCFLDSWMSRFTDACENFFGRGDVGQSFADSAPAFASIGIDQQRGIQSDVLAFHSTARVNQAIGANYPGARIAQGSELTVHYLLPDRKCMLAIVHTQGYYPRIEKIKFFAVTRELAQLAHAVGSPVAAVEDQQHALTAQRRKAKRFAVFVLQGKLWRGLANCGRSMWSGQDLGCGKC